MGRPPAAELQARLDHELARKVGEFNAIEVQQALQALRAFIELDHVQSGEVLALLDARVRELKPAR